MEKVLEEHEARDRPGELGRSKAAHDAFVAGGSKKKKRAPADATASKRPAKDPEDWSDSDEEEEHRVSTREKMRRQDEESASYEGDDEVAEPRAKSRRQPKQTRVLVDYDCESGSDSAPPPEAPPKRAKKAAGKAVLLASAAPPASAKSARTGKTAIAAALPVPVAVAPVAVARPKRTDKKAAEKAASKAAEKAASAISKRVSGSQVLVTVAPSRASAPPRKRPVEPSALVAKAAAEPVVIDADDFQGEDVPDTDMINATLVPDLGHVANTVVDDYVQLLKRYLANAWPKGTLVETTARWVQFGTDMETRRKSLDALFAQKNRLDGITRVLWPTYKYMGNSGHFALLVIDVEKRSIRLLDSIAGIKWDLSWVQGLLRRAFGWKANARVEIVKCRQQGNSDDCGVYIMGNLRSFLGDVDFNDERMPGTHLDFDEKTAAVLALRAHFAAELRRGKLIKRK